MPDEAEYMEIFAMIKAIDIFLMEGRTDLAISLSAILNRTIDTVYQQHGGLIGTQPM